jgi:preprotein translocase subunit SecF
MIVGIITGTYSSVFIASSIVVIWQGKEPVKVAPSSSANAPTAPKKKSDKRRAS